MLDSSSSTEPDIVLAAQVLQVLNAVAALAGVDVLVIGATARNMLCTALFDRMPERATRDVDIAVAVPTWRAYHQPSTSWDCARPTQPHKRCGCPAGSRSMCPPWPA